MSPAESDVALLARIRDGDESAFEALYKERFAPLVLYTAHLVGSRDAAVDVVQDVFTALWRKRDSVEVHGSLASYLYGACRNTARDRIRSEQARVRRGVSYMAESADVYEDTRVEEEAADALVAAVWRTVDTLPPRARDVFILSRRDGLSHAQIASKLGIAAKTVEMHVARALQSLREALGPRRSGE